jgi:tetratricopeptide (TPR) repeat protein
MSEHGTLTLLRSPEPMAEVIDLEGFKESRHTTLVDEARRLMIEGRDDLALDRCNEALRLVPDSEQALVLAGTLAMVAGDTPEALRFAFEMVQIDPEEADGYYEVALSLIDLAHPEEALAWLEMGHERLGGRDDELVDFFHAAQAEALALLERFEEAEALLEQSRDARGDDLGLYADAGERIRLLAQRPRC